MRWGRTIPTSPRASTTWRCSTNPFIAGQSGFLDDVILPRNTRARVCGALAMLRDKRLDNPAKKHGNIPL